MKLFYLTSTLYLIVFLTIWNNSLQEDVGIKRGMMSLEEKPQEKTREEIRIEEMAEIGRNKELPDGIDTSKPIAPVQRLKKRNYFQEVL